MNEHDAKMGSVALIWIGMGIAAGLTNIGGSPTFYSIVMTAIFCLTALAATVLVWRSPVSGSPGKAKREDSASDARLDLLLKLMDEDDRRTLKNRLVSEVQSDGEMPGTANLFVMKGER